MPDGCDAMRTSEAFVEYALFRRHAGTLCRAEARHGAENAVLMRGALKLKNRVRTRDKPSTVPLLPPAAHAKEVPPHYL